MEGLEGLRLESVGGSAFRSAVKIVDPRSVDILYATNRAPYLNEEGKVEGFTSVRSRDLIYGAAVVR
jgi:hypothetical protein